MLKATAKFIGGIFVKPTDGLNCMDVNMVSHDYDETIHIDIRGLKNEGIKDIRLVIGHNEFMVRIERIDGKITSIDRENDGKSLVVESGFFWDGGTKIYEAGEHMTKKFPSVFGKVEEKEMASQSNH